MNPAEVALASMVLVVVYAYAIYPLGVWAAAAVRPRPVRYGAFGGSVSVVLSAFNEEATVARRLHDMGALLSASGLDGELILVSDGSTDGTAGAARSVAGSDVRVVELPENLGKAAALSAGCAAARGDVLVFADTRQVWAPDALEMLLQGFADPEVGAVSGELLVESAPGVLAGVGLYWRYEKSLRRWEGRVHSTVGVSGSICAVRRALFRPIPRGTILDDVYWPLRVVAQGYRVVHDMRACAYDRLPARTRDEFRRKVRTLSGNFQLLTLLPEALVPWRNPIWAQFVSHKLLRLLVPWALIAILALSLTADVRFSRALLGGQALLYGVGLLGLVGGVGSRSRLASAAASFLVLNSAAWVAFWVWATGRAEKSWGKVVYAARFE